MDKYLKELEKVEKRTTELLKELKVKYSAKRLFSFATLNLLEANTENLSFKIVASENFDDVNNPEKINTAIGILDKVKKKTTKYQIFHLGQRKLLKMTKEDALEYLSKGLEVLALYDKYRAVRTDFEAEHRLRFIKHVTLNELHSIENVKREDSVYIKMRHQLPNDKEFVKWDEIIVDMDSKDESFKKKISKEMSIKK